MRVFVIATLALLLAAGPAHAWSGETRESLGSYGTGSTKGLKDSGGGNVGSLSGGVIGAGLGWGMGVEICGATCGAIGAAIGARLGNKLGRDYDKGRRGNGSHEEKSRPGTL